MKVTFSVHSSYLDVPALAYKGISFECQKICKLAKVARIAITALVFTLCHTSRMGHLLGMLLPQLVAGIYFSYRREQGASIVHLLALHVVYNIAGAILGGGITSAPPKLS